MPTFGLFATAGKTSVVSAPSQPNTGTPDERGRSWSSVFSTNFT